MIVTINDYEFTVHIVDGENEKMKVSDDIYHIGLTEYVDLVINLRRGMPTAMTRATVIHELIHAFIFAYGYELNDEESVCNFFGAMGDKIIKLADEICTWVVRTEC